MKGEFMADISMCMKEDCKKQYICYRKTAIPTPNWQSYSMFQNCNEETGFEDYLPSRKDVKACTSGSGEFSFDI